MAYLLQIRGEKGAWETVEVSTDYKSALRWARHRRQLYPNGARFLRAGTCADRATALTATALRQDRRAA